VDDDGLVLLDAFLPSYKCPNGDQETSINWEDDETVEAKTLADRSHAEHGAARLPLSELAQIVRKDSASGFLFAERTDPTPHDNPHHGDIVYRQHCQPKRIKMLANRLAIDSKLVLPPPR
jgi:hypothetical protein